MKTLYTAHATTVGGREGRVSTDDKKIDMTLTRPGATGAGTNPEQLFAAAYSACFGGAVAAVSKSQGVDGVATVKSEVNLNKDDENGFSLSATIDANIEGLDDSEKLEEIILSAHHMCPYSRAIRGNVEVKLKANGRAIN